MWLFSHFFHPLGLRSEVTFADLDKTLFWKASLRVNFWTFIATSHDFPHTKFILKNRIFLKEYQFQMSVGNQSLLGINIGLLPYFYVRTEPNLTWFYFSLSYPDLFWTSVCFTSPNFAAQKNNLKKSNFLKELQTKMNVRQPKITCIQYWDGTLHKLRTY